MGGQIPTTLGKLTRLRELGLAYNDLAGTLPSELGNLAMLTELHVAGNHDMRGAVPRSILTLPRLHILSTEATLLEPFDLEPQPIGNTMAPTPAPTSRETPTPGASPAPTSRETPT
eukprot:CAMPEP_0118958444 /NCGR_PEP_ID=MMETSP1169-20130426/62625_1 /TAXON_ID=36882 /ORGANISM="Pyramimonas obovata, Strain CCMP722" /LENGTH=115 /DNA_ID=CAMNT_0006906559 /DNA_START=1629 /DNA_END=1972 /DNA_ORIENTATION=+